MIVLLLRFNISLTHISWYFQKNIPSETLVNIGILKIIKKKFGRMKYLNLSLSKNLKLLEIMKNTNETLREAFEKGNLVTFRTETSREKNVKIVKLNTDDVENKEFTFETSKGERYTRFSNNIWF